MRARLFVYSLLAGTCSCSPIGSDHPATPTPPAPRIAARAQAVHEREDFRVDDILFLGDSIVELWATAGAPSWTHSIHPLGARNLGVGGDRTQSLLWRLADPRLRDVKPPAIVLLVGSNNVADARHSADEIAAGILRVVDECHLMWPAARVLVLGLLPRVFESDNQDAVLSAVNSLLRDSAFLHGAAYLELSHLLLAESNLVDRALLPDGVHPNESGYALMTEAVIPFLLDSARRTEE